MSECKVEGAFEKLTGTDEPYVRITEEERGKFHHPTTAAGKLQWLRVWIEDLMLDHWPKLDELDPRGESRSVARMRESLTKIGDELCDYLDNGTVPPQTQMYPWYKPCFHREYTPEECELHYFLEYSLKGSIQGLIGGIKTLEFCRDEYGLSPCEVEARADHYGVEFTYLGMADIEEIKERAFLARIRSNQAGSKNLRITDDRIRTVLMNYGDKTREKQAEMLHMTVRQLQRRLKKMEE